MLTRRERKKEHKTKMARKDVRRLHAEPTELQDLVARMKKNGTFADAMMNYSRHPKGEKRTRPPVYS